MKLQYVAIKLPRNDPNYAKEWYQANKNIIKAKQNAYYHTTKSLKRYREPGKLGISREDPNYMRVWYAANKERQNAKTKAYYEANKTHILARILKRQKDNPERTNEKLSAWRRVNPESRATEKARRTALMRSAPGNHTKMEIKTILLAQNYLCANPFCRVDLQKVKKHLDHIVALSTGGTNYASNLQWLCMSCNTKKQDKDWDEWLSQQICKAE